jgi:signal transduction histidine kinase
VVIGSVWFITFPLNRPFDVLDIVFEGAYFITASIALFFIDRMRLRILDAGWVVFSTGLFIDLLDEFTSETDILSLHVEGAFKIAGLVIIAWGLYSAVSRYERQLQERARREERASFLSRLISHDMKNRIHALLNYTDLFKASAIDKEEYVGRIDTAARNSARLLEKMHEVIELNKHEDIHPVRLDEVFSSIEEIYGHTAKREGISFEIDELPYMVQGGRMLTYLFSNIVENAIEHANCSMICIRARGAGEFVDVTVEDDGTGIPDDVKATIFGDEKRSTSSTGWGVGMHLIRDIAAHYGGLVTVGDSTLGGTAVKVRLRKVK